MPYKHVISSEKLAWLASEVGDRTTLLVGKARLCQRQARYRLCLCTDRCTPRRRGTGGGAGTTQVGSGARIDDDDDLGF